MPSPDWKAVAKELAGALRDADRWIEHFAKNAGPKTWELIEDSPRRQCFLDALKRYQEARK